jgi:secretion/DNA translocation related TadE-like protein
MTSPGRADAGSATVYVLWLVGVLLALGAGLAVWASAVAARHQASSAADLAALAGAARAVEGSVSACAAAGRVAAANGAKLVSCALSGSAVEVAVQVRPRAGDSFEGFLGVPLPAATARARAGPEELRAAGDRTVARHGVVGAAARREVTLVPDLLGEPGVLLRQRLPLGVTALAQRLDLGATVAGPAQPDDEECDAQQEHQHRGRAGDEQPGLVGADRDAEGIQLGRPGRVQQHADRHQDRAKDEHQS